MNCGTNRDLFKSETSPLRTNESEEWIQSVKDIQYGREQKWDPFLLHNRIKGESFHQSSQEGYGSDVLRTFSILGIAPARGKKYMSTLGKQFFQVCEILSALT
ncbi:hypothetical protein TNCV_2296251 [Trichonephila clavipes]|nr:hypothetical protein TNCV_2296251 [Trichonephila clavipes]